MKYWLMGLFYVLIIAGCTGSRNLLPHNMNIGQSAKIVYIDGRSENVYISAKDENELTVVSESDHTKKTVPINDIRNISHIDVFYDDLAYPISSAEIEKYKQSRNAWGYAIGGAVAGGAIGLVAALPFWYAEVGGVPPYFVAGGGAIVGSIYFALKGQDKDKMIAVEEIRSIRQIERDMEAQIESEKKQIEKLKKEKAKLEEEIQNPDTQSNR
jgi:hypothetical protein